MPFCTKSQICTPSSKCNVPVCFDLKKSPVKEDQGGKLGKGLKWEAASPLKVPGGFIQEICNK